MQKLKELENSSLAFFSGIVITLSIIIFFNNKDINIENKFIDSELLKGKIDSIFIKQELHDTYIIKE